MGHSCPEYEYNFRWRSHLSRKTLMSFCIRVFRVFGKTYCSPRLCLQRMRFLFHTEDAKITVNFQYPIFLSFCAGTQDRTTCEHEAALLQFKCIQFGMLVQTHPRLCTGTRAPGSCPRTSLGGQKTSPLLDWGWSLHWRECHCWGWEGSCISLARNRPWISQL